MFTIGLKKHCNILSHIVCTDSGPGPAEQNNSYLTWAALGSCLQGQADADVLHQEKNPEKENPPRFILYKLHNALFSCFR